MIESSSPSLSAGRQVLAHGYDLGVSHHGGFAELARVPAGWVVPLPDGLTSREAMAIGTAGYTAAQCIVALEERGLAPGDGEVLVLGASGGVGSVAVSILAGRGYTVAAVTGKPEQSDLLRELGASEIIARDEVTVEGKPLERERWAGCVDAVGGAPLAYALRTLRYGASAASCGNVAGGDLHTTIFPFILRGVSLLGIDSSQTPIAKRREIWNRLGGDLRPGMLDDSLVHETTLDGLGDVLATGLTGAGVGRTVVNVGG